MRILFLVLLVLFASHYVSAQEKKKKKKSSKDTEQQQPTSLDPFYPTTTYEPKKSKKKSKGLSVTYNPEQQFAERMEKVAKERRKTERKMDHPQYSDPSYFGHKKPPIKRPPGKMKYCKECGLKH